MNKQINVFTESHFIDFLCSNCGNNFRISRNECRIHRNFTLTVNRFLRCFKCDLFFAVEKSQVIVSVLNNGRQLKDD
jgi:predicted RNA-binding Zn-ribbon protein involved in translation (DUF1610 family)